MNLGKKIRMQRLFSHPSGRFFSVAFDHFMGYDLGLPEGLRCIKKTIDAVAEARPAALTIHKDRYDRVYRACGESAAHPAADALTFSSCGR